jgi:hypothetical protein
MSYKNMSNIILTYKYLKKYGISRAYNVFSYGYLLENNNLNVLCFGFFSGHFFQTILSEI